MARRCECVCAYRRSFDWRALTRRPAYLGTIAQLLNWYILRNKPVTPLHPVSTEWSGPNGIYSPLPLQKEDVLGDIPTIRNLSDLEDPESTSLSIVTPPKVHLGVFEYIEANPQDCR